MKLRPRKKTEQQISDVMKVIKVAKDGTGTMQQFRRESDGEPREGQFTLKRNGRIYCPTKRGEKVYVDYLSRFYEQI